MAPWLRHAFALHPEGPHAPSAAEMTVVRQLCRDLAARRLTMVTQMLLEMYRPFVGLSPQLIWFITPWLAPFMNTTALSLLERFLQRPRAIDLLLVELEAAAANVPRPSDPGN